MKKLIKKVLLWDYISLKNKKRIKSFFGKKTVHKAKAKAKPKAKANEFSNLFNRFAVTHVNFSHMEVALYFAGSMGNIYQVEQWIGALASLEDKKSLTIIVRDKNVFTWLSKNTTFTTVYCLTIEDLTDFYDENNFKCILYVNHGFKNFQSLITGDALHVHINHGESDKTSTITNQSKAYDYIFIVSDAGYDKYHDNLIKVDMNKFIKIGRPQLDHIEKIEPFDKNCLEPIVEEEVLEEKASENEELLDENKILSDESLIDENIILKEIEVPDRKVILYAPTWEGTHDSMNFTSLNDYGMELVTKLLEDPNIYLLYKPHPNTGSRDSVAKRINNDIKKLINGHYKGVVVKSRDINSLYEHVDLAIFDNSAVAIDYLQVDKPMIMTDMFYRITKRQSKPTIVKAARMLSVEESHNILSIIEDELVNDTVKEQRNKVKEYFLGNYDYDKKESTQKFIDTIVQICEERDELVERLAEFNLKKEPFLDNKND